jgi:two-component system sensor histidine kinase MprB
VSHHRRITAAATLAVAAVCLTFGIVGYLATRAKLTGEIKQELKVLAKPYLLAHPVHGPQTGALPGATFPSVGGGGSNAGVVPLTGLDGDHARCTAHQPADDERGPDVRVGGATGHFQSVCPDGRVMPIDGGVRLPVTSRVLAVARMHSPAYYFTATVDRIHVMIYVAPDRADHKAVEGDLPLSTVDSTMRSLVITYALLIGFGVLVAGIVGAIIARSALAPIMRFTSRTEQVTSALDHPRRLDEEGAIEIRRLAASFNQTLTALERSVEAQRHLIADASHELRTPIAALRSNIQIFLEADQLPAEEQAELRDAIVAELDDLTQLVADVLELARGSAPNEHVEELELDAIVREAIDRARRRSPQISFEAELEPTLIQNSADRVSRAVTNVVENARKWSPDGGSVEVTLTDGLLTVRDHGPGFRDEDLPHVFERFYRSADARRMPGSGLGLAIVKQAAEAHGGRASVANSPDGGAVVRVSFGPARSGAPDSAAQGPADTGAYP